METRERRQKSGTAPRRERRTKPNPAEAVYTPPKPFSRRRLLLRLATVVAVVLALLFGMAIFFKVKVVNVSGVEKYTAWDVREASQLHDGENLMTISYARVSGKIMARLPYVKSARIRIKLPDTVNIEITELDVVYAIETDTNAWWLMSADGKLVEATGAPDGYTKILGVQITDPEINAQAKACEQPAATGEGESTTPVTVRESEKLQAAVQILKALEENTVIGTVSKIDASNPGNLEFWYSDRYQVVLGDSSRLNYKVEAMKKAVDQMNDYQSGTLDVSFTTWPNEVGYTPFP